MMNDLDAVCESIWQRATREIPIHTVEANRQRQGSYINGFRNDTEVWNFVENDHTIRATKIAWQRFNLNLDSDGTRRILEMIENNAVTFKAVKEDKITNKRFIGHDERYVGTDTTEPTSWRVVEGTPPVQGES